MMVSKKSKLVLGKVVLFLVKCLFKVLSMGPIPKHIGFIMDGNRRYEKKLNSAVEYGHKAGYFTMIVLILYCFELGVKYVTVYAFSIDNFKRSPEEVRCLLDLILEKIEVWLDPESFINKNKIRVQFVGDLELLPDPMRLVAENLMRATANYSNMVISLCVAYTSRHEIVHAVKKACEEKIISRRFLLADQGIEKIGDQGIEKISGMKLVDIERHMGIAPDPDLIVRSSGEKRLSNFLLWQSPYCQLHSPAALWPELGLWHLVWTVLDYQRSYGYLEMKKKNV